MGKPSEARRCERCGGKRVNPEVAARRLKQFGVIFCSDCKFDKNWLTRVQTKG